MLQASLVKVRDFMTKHVLTISHTFRVGDAIGKMAEKNVGSLVVMSGKDPIGILSERDLVSRLMAKGKTPRTRWSAMLCLEKLSSSIRASR
jgi:CBS domain-containing protein